MARAVGIDLGTTNSVIAAPEVTAPGSSWICAMRGGSGVTVPCAVKPTGVRSESPNAMLSLGRSITPNVAAAEVADAVSVLFESHGWYSAFLHSPRSAYVMFVWSKLPTAR
jgi:hypothetical protein